MDECTERGFSSTESNERLQAIILIYRIANDYNGPIRAATIECLR